MSEQEVARKLPYSGKFWSLVAPIARHYIKKLYGAELATKAYRDGKPIYRKLIDRSPAIGANNPMAKNLYLACVVFALWKAADGAITPDMMRQVLKAIFDSKMMRMAGNKGDLRKPGNMARLVEDVHANARWQKDHPSIASATWAFHFDDERGGTIAHYFWPT